MTNNKTTNVYNAANFLTVKYDNYKKIMIFNFIRNVLYTTRKLKSACIVG